MYRPLTQPILYANCLNLLLKYWAGQKGCFGLQENLSRPVASLMLLIPRNLQLSLSSGRSFFQSPSRLIAQLSFWGPPSLPSWWSSASLLCQSYHFLISLYLCPRVTPKNHHKCTDWKQGEFVPVQFWRPGFPSQGLGMVLLPPGAQGHPPLPLVASAARGCAWPRLSCNSGLLPSTRGHVPGVSAKSASAFLIGGWPYLNSFNLIMSTKTLHSNRGAFTGSGRNYHAGGHRSTHYTLVFLSLGRSSSLENHALSSGNVPDLFIYF